MIKINHLLKLIIVLATTHLATAQTPRDTLHPGKIKAPRVGNDIYVRAGYLVPLGSFAETPRVTTMLANPAFIRIMEQYKSGMGAMPGWEFTYGVNYILSKEGKNPAIGLNVTYLNYAIIPYSWNKGGTDYAFSGATYKQMNNFSVGLGPSIRFKLSNSMRLMMYYQMCPTRSSHGSWTNSLSETFYLVDTTITVAQQVSMEFKRGYGLKHNFGAQLTINKFCVGATFSAGNIKFNKVEYKSSVQVYGNYRDQNNDLIQFYGFDRYTFEKAALMPQPYLNFFIGFNFTRRY